MRLSLDEIESRLLMILGGLSGKLEPHRIEMIADLVKAGEPGVALENLCSELDEYDVIIPQPALIEIATLGTAMRIKPDYWQRLKDLPEH